MLAIMALDGWMSALGYARLCLLLPLLYSQLFFTHPQPHPNSQYLKTDSQNDPPPVLPHRPEDVTSPFTPQLLAVEKRKKTKSFSGWPGVEWTQARGCKQQVLPIGRPGVSSQKGLTKIAYSRSGDPTGNLSLCMGWRRCLVNPLAPELRTSLFTSPSLSLCLRSPGSPPAVSSSCRCVLLR